MQRVERLSQHLCAAEAPAGSPGAVSPPVVRAGKEMHADPVAWLLEQSKAHPEMFIVDRGNGHRYAVVSDVSLFEDVLTFDAQFGNPQTSNMSVNRSVFLIPPEQLERHEQPAISGLRRHVLNHNAELADSIARRLEPYLREVLGDSGEMDLRDLGAAVFWPMTAALFGERAGKAHAPHLLADFETIDGSFGAALRGKPVPAAREAVTRANVLFEGILHDSKQPGGRAAGPLVALYDEVTGAEDPTLTAKLSTAAWWGGQGNTLPSTVWTFGLVLGDPEARRRAYAEVDGAFAAQPGPDGRFDYETLPFLTAALKETLRMKTFSVAWRQAQQDAVLTAKSGTRYLLPSGTLLGLHFAMRHMDPAVHPEPGTFRPDRFLGSGSGLSPTVGGHEYAWVPFSAGRHKCAGYALAMLEIPVIMALMLRTYDMELLDPLPGMDYGHAFGVVAPDAKPARVRYTKRH